MDSSTPSLSPSLSPSPSPSASPQISSSSSQTALINKQPNSMHKSQFQDRQRSIGSALSATQANIISRYGVNTYGVPSPSTPNSIHASLFAGGQPTVERNEGSRPSHDIHDASRAQFSKASIPSSLSQLPHEHVVHSTSTLELCSDECLCERDGHKPPFTWSGLLAFSGVSWITSVAFVDPGNLEVDFQYGITYQYKLVWVILLTTIMAIVLQTLAARLGIVTGKHLAEHCHDQYPRSLRVIMFTVSQVGIIAFDVAEVIGTAIALQVLFHIPVTYGMVISALDTMLILFLQKYGASVLEAAVESLLLVLASCFVVELLMCRPDPKALLLGAITPSLPNAQAAISAISVLGATIMGHNLFLHSGLILSRCEPGSYQTRHKTRGILMYATTEAAIALFASFLINASVMGISGAKLFVHRFEPGFEDVGLKDASILLANVLEKYANWIPKIWGIALFCSGHCATVTGTYASQLVVEGFWGLERDQMKNSWVTNMFTRTAAILPALVICLFAGEHVADRLVVGTQLVIAAELPFAVIPLLRFVGSDEIMGVTFHTSRVLLVAGWIISIVCMGASIFLVFQGLREIINFLLGSVWSSHSLLLGSASSALVMLMLGLTGLAFLIGYFRLLWLLFTSPIIQPRHNADHHLYECPQYVPQTTTEIEVTETTCLVEKGTIGRV